MSTPGGYRGGRSLGKQLNLYRNPNVLNILRCTDNIPGVLMISPSVLNIPWCTAKTLYRVFLELHSGCPNWPRIHFIYFINSLANTILSSVLSRKFRFGKHMV